MDANRLLLKLSARQSGSWQQFKAAVEEFRSDEQGELSSPTSEDEATSGSLPIYHLARLNLERLAHAEFFAAGCETGWRVTAPTLAISRRSNDWFGVLTGARSPHLLTLFMAAAKSLNVQCNPLDLSPDKWTVTADDKNALATAANQSGLAVQIHAPTAVLLSLPTIDDQQIHNRAELPLGGEWIIARFSTSAQKWRPSSREEILSTTYGLFRFSHSYQRDFYLAVNGNAFKVPGAVGKYLMLRHQRRCVIKYDGQLLRLTVPAILRPPLLIERAFVLCSGQLPDYDVKSHTLHYSEITRSIALLTAQLLRQELR